MGTKTGISWTDATWNPIRGCSRVSEGCRHCYAEVIAKRFSGPGLAYEGLVRLSESSDVRKPVGWNGQIKFVEEHLLDPLKWKKPRRIFVNSMSDLFHENVTDEMRDRIYAVIALCPQHTFQILTKRPERRLEYLSAPHRKAAVWMMMGSFDRGLGMPCPIWPLPNAHEGVSGEDQETVTKRTWILLQTPAAVRFLSLEPMLGPVDLNAGELICSTWRKGATIGRYLDWVIVGGESGAGARPMHPDWARSLRDQCKAAGVPFFFKQWGEYAPSIYGAGPTPDHLPDSAGFYFHAPHAPHKVWRFGTKASGCLLDGVEHHEFPAAVS